MKTATVTIESICLLCPQCEAEIPAPNGSLFLTEQEFRTLPAIVECECGGKFRKPRIVWRREAK